MAGQPHDGLASVCWLLDAPSDAGGSRIRHSSVGVLFRFFQKPLAVRPLGGWSCQHRQKIQSQFWPCLQQRLSRCYMLHVQCNCNYQAAPLVDRAMSQIPFFVYQALLTVDLAGWPKSQK